MKPKKTTNTTQIPKIVFGKRNILIFASGIPVLILGFYLMTFGPWDNPLSRSVSPLILLFGYLVVFPIAILYKDKGKPVLPIAPVKQPDKIKVEQESDDSDRRYVKQKDRRAAATTQRKSHPTLDRRKTDRRDL